MGHRVWVNDEKKEVNQGKSQTNSPLGRAIAISWWRGIDFGSKRKLWMQSECCDYVKIRRLLVLKWGKIK